MTYMKKILLKPFAALFLLFLLLGAEGVWGQVVTQTFNADGTWTVPCGVTSVTVQLWGAGGGGGKADNGVAGGGGGGGYVQVTFAVTPGQNIAYNVGTIDDPASPGADGSSGGGTVGGGSDNGYNGWSTSFLSAIAQGGEGGLSFGNGGAGGAGGGTGVAGANSGGSGTSITIINGSNGSNGGAGGAGGNGGNAPGTGGAAPIAGTDDSNPGISPGGGGSGASDTGGSSVNGPDGAGGRIIITYTGPFAGPDQTLAACTTSTTLAANSPAGAGSTGTWSCVSGCTGVTITTPTSPTSTVTGLNPGINTVLQWTWTGGGAGCTSTNDQVQINTTAGTGCWNYCTSSPNSTLQYIQNVTFNTINNTTGGTSYSDNTGSCTSVILNSTYTVSVTIQAAGTEHVFAVFDWNNDGDFSDAGEAYDLGESAVDGAVLTANITIPAGATLGNTVMRILMSYNTNPVSPFCSVGTYGEIEDYCVTIMSCTTTPANAGPDQTLGSCVNTSVLAATPVNAGAGEIGYWTLLTGDAVLSNMNDPVASVSVLGPGLITLQWTVQSGQPGCPDLTDQMTITTLNLPTAPDAGPDFTTCLSTTTLNGNTPAGGETGLWTVAPAGPTFSAPNSATTNVNGMVVGTTYTFTWTISNIVPCSTSDNIVVTTVPSLSANAGPNLASCTGSEINFQGVAPTAGVGTWTGTPGVITNVNSATSSLNAVNIPGTYTYTWTVSALGCANAVDQMQIVYTFCDPNLTTLTCAGPAITFTDGGSDYANNAHIVRKYCPNVPGQVVQANFTQMTMATAADHMIVLNGADYTAPIIDDFYSLPTIANNPIISSSSDGCLTFIFMSSAANNAAGWSAQIDCVTPPATSNNVESCDETNCLGGCLRTLCGVPASVTFQGDGIGSEELNAVDGGCLAAGEQCSNWFLINPATISSGNPTGTLSMNMFVNNGQDQDYAVWEAYAPNLNCPAMTGDSPIRCNFAGSSNEGTGFNDVLDPAYAAYDASLTITQNQIDNGVYYIILVNTFNNGGACPQPEVDITFGGDIGLTCDPPIPLGSNFINFHGVAEERYNFLMWETMNDEKTAHYILERSQLGNSWEYVGTVQSNYSPDGGQYTMYDQHPYAPFTYYRIKQVNMDGESEYTQIISVSRGVLDGNWVSNLIPNPATSEFSFQYQGKNFSEPVVVNVINNIGQIVYAEEHNIENKTAVTISTDNLANGTYQVMITQGELKMMKRLVVVK